jgi:hypothetical protein
MARTRLLLLLCWALAALASASAQTPQDDLLVRMERLRRHDDVCVLINRSGAYRLEWTYPAKTEVYIGTLPAANTHDLEEFLNKEELRQLSQQQIIAPLKSDDIDTFMLQIRREHRWQELAFAPESRKPFAALLDPLIRSLDMIGKSHPGAALVNTAMNRCAPPAERVLRAASAERESNGRPQASPSYLMRIQFDHPAGWLITRTCAIVFPDGRYHYEKSDQRALEKESRHVFEGTIARTQLQELQTLLDDPQLKLLKHRSFPAGVTASEFEIAILSISRPDGVQNLTFSSYFGTHKKATEPGALSNMNYSTDEEAKMLTPVRNWVKEVIDKTKGKEIKHAVANACVPPSP